MTTGKLSPLQEKVLVHLAHLEPPWTLVGGAALAGFHLAHRATRDLDLFWRERAELGELPRAVENRLATAGLGVDVLERAPAFMRLRVADATEAVVVDLVADPAAPAVPDVVCTVGDVAIRVADRRDILVAKLCALLGRSELRDLVDLELLLSQGGDLEWAVAKSPDLDAGFSALTLAWVLETLDLERLARRTGVEPGTVEGLTLFRDDLVQRLLALARPG